MISFIWNPKEQCALDHLSVTHTFAHTLADLAHPASFCQVLQEGNQRGQRKATHTLQHERLHTVTKPCVAVKRHHAPLRNSETRKSHTHLSVVSACRGARGRRVTRPPLCLRVLLRFVCKDECSPCLQIILPKLHTEEAQNRDEDTHAHEHTPVHPLLQCHFSSPPALSHATDQVVSLRR